MYVYIHCMIERVRQEGREEGLEKGREEARKVLMLIAQITQRQSDSLRTDITNMYQGVEITDYDSHRLCQVALQNALVVSLDIQDELGELRSMCIAAWLRRYTHRL
eukprot:GHVU01073705.1.p1 GENE.GHVU01073705.1~~GHVU01073705.1.p1  ORF type:complete len:106 (-),score=11.07 GHVU01073705.1:107-424(-)